MVELGTTYEPDADRTSDDRVVLRIVAEVMARVPASADRSALERAGRRAAAGLRLRTAPGVVTPADLDTAVRRALVQHLNGAHPAPARVPDSAPVGPTAERARVAARLAILTPLQRQVVEGYFIADRGVAGLSAELGLSAAELVRVRTGALLELRTVLAHA
jgi:hypothetical protein